MSLNIPLSYNPIPIRELTQVLERYKDAHHQLLINDFEVEISRITGSKYVVALNSGTSAIHLGLKLLGVGKGDLVICPTFTYVASVNPVLYLGAEPVFVDCEMDTWCMDPEMLEKALQELNNQGKKPKAIVVVYAYGMPGKIDDLIAVASRFGVPVLEDAAEALGSISKGRHVGTIGDVGIISFNNNKIVTTYGGGVLLVKTKEACEKALFWATQAREDQPFYEHKEVGYNYRMGTLNAAAGLAKLPDMEQTIKARREAFFFYRAELGDQVMFQQEQTDDFANYWLSTCYKLNSNPIALIGEFRNAGYEIRPVWKPMHQQSLFAGVKHYLNGNAELIFRSGISLPSAGIKPADRKLLALLKGV